MMWLALAAGVVIGTIAIARPKARSIESDRRARIEAWQRIHQERELAAHRDALHVMHLDAFGRKARHRAERIERIRSLMGERQ